MKKFIFLAVTLVFASAAFAEDFEYNTGGSIDYEPDEYGSSVGWGEWFITTVQNDTGETLLLTELGFPMCGPPTGDYGWIVWIDVGGENPPVGDVTTADFYDAFTPVDPDSTGPPINYTYIDVSAENILIPNGNFFCFGYDNVVFGGLTAFNGTVTYSWWDGSWDSDEPYGITSVLQVFANYATALEQTTWGSIKSVF